MLDPVTASNSLSLFDILDGFFYKNAFDSDSFFQSILQPTLKINYPVDIIDKTDSLEINIAAVGLEKKDIKIQTKDNRLSVCYDKTIRDDTNKYIHQGITKKSFNQEWVVGDNFDISKISVTLDKGLLSIKIPVVKKQQPEIKDIFIK